MGVEIGLAGGHLVSRRLVVTIAKAARLVRNTEESHLSMTCQADQSMAPK